MACTECEEFTQQCHNVVEAENHTKKEESVKVKADNILSMPTSAQILSFADDCNPILYCKSHD